MSRRAAHWARYNAHQLSRSEPRELCRIALREAGPGHGRVALDLGAGSGTESVALLDAGWRVHAVDTDGIALAALRDRVPDEVRGRLTTEVADLAATTHLPAADLIYSGYTLSWLPPEGFSALWEQVRAGLEPGGLVAVNVFGDRDTWADDPTLTCLPEDRVDALFDGWEIVHRSVEDADGGAFSGPKHWHVVDVIARRPC